MFVFYGFLILVWFVWIRRAVQAIGSIRRYSILPLESWRGESEAAPVSVIVPCRNEARNLAILLPSLLGQDYPNIEFIFLDDRSEDDTLNILRDSSARDPRIRVLEGAPLPAGWTGKNHAMFQCAGIARGRWLLFTDADTEHQPNSVSSTLRYATERNIDLLTLSAQCVCKSFGEHLVQPMGIGCFSVWFKIAEVNDPRSTTPLACGQYFLIKKEVYDAVGGNTAVKDAVTEDLEMFKIVKAAGYTCELAIGAHVFATRMYRSFKESWTGWRRIYLHALNKNVPSLVSKILMLIFFSFMPFALFAASLTLTFLGHENSAGLAALSGSLCGFILFLRSRSHLALKASQGSIFLHPLSALVIAAILADCLRHLWMGKKVVWKEERY